VIPPPTSFIHPGATPGVFASQGVVLHHAPHPPHNLDGLEGERGIPVNPRHKNPPYGQGSSREARCEGKKLVKPAPWGASFTTTLMPTFAKGGFRE
jgi:hypothetical protein